MLYDTCRRTPKQGTLLEAALLLVWKARRDIDLAGVRAQAQASIGGDKAVEAFSEFAHLVNRVEIEDRNRKMKTQLDELKKIKEIRIQPMRATEKVVQLPTVHREDVIPTSQYAGLKPLSGGRSKPSSEKSRR